MKRFAIGLLIAVLGIATLVGIAVASGGGSPSPQEGETAQQQGWLGVHIANVNERLVDRFHLTVKAGVVIVKVVPDGPADAAGLQAGDVIQAINGVAVSSVDAAVSNVDQVINAIRALSPGTVVTLTVLRGGEEISIEATLAARPQPLVPSYLKRLLGQGLPGNLLHAEFEILSTNDTVITVGLTLGEVQSTTDTGLLTIVRKDDQVVEFSTTADTKVIVGGHPINLEGLKEETPVLVVEKDGAVALVIGWPGDLLPRPKPMREKPWRQHFRTDKPHLWSPGMEITPERIVPEVFTLPDAGALRQRLQKLLPVPELRRELQGRVWEVRPEWQFRDAAPFIQPEAPGRGDTL